MKKTVTFPWPVAVIRSARRTVSVEISREGDVILRIPNGFPASEVPSFLTEKQSWIEKNLARRKAELGTGEPPYTASELRRLAEKARETVPERVRFFAARMGVSYGRVTIRRQRTRWGSCTAEGNLNFNCLLADMPSEVLDYVVVHELSHRLEMNHSARFWARVEKVLPDFRARRLWLKRNGGAYLARAFAPGPSEDETDD